MTHWKKLTNPDYIGAYAFEPGQQIIATIKSAGIEKVVGQQGKKEDCTVVRFVEKDVKPLIVNATNAKAISKVANSPYIENWTGVRVQMGVEKISAFGDVMEAVRVRDFAPKIEQNTNINCSDCNSILAGFKKMNAMQLAEYTQKKYRKILCGNCATKLAQEAEQNNGDVLCN